jgi:hypothetical protein
LVRREIAPVADGEREESCLLKHGQGALDGSGLRDGVVAADGEADAFEEVRPDYLIGSFGFQMASRRFWFESSWSLSMVPYVWWRWSRISSGLKMQNCTRGHVRHRGRCGRSAL